MLPILSKSSRLGNGTGVGEVIGFGGDVGLGVVVTFTSMDGTVVSFGVNDTDDAVGGIVSTWFKEGLEDSDTKS